MNKKLHKDVVIIGAGASGLMCAIEAAKRGRDVVVIEHANKVGKKILMSGGGRCNFTNYQTMPERFISENAHFCKSALSRYTHHDFIDLVEAHQIPYYEKTLGQLFCVNKSKDIVELLLAECEAYGANIKIKTSVESVEKLEVGFRLNTTEGVYHCDSLVIASGGLSIPTMGATGFGYDIAKQFGLEVLPTTAALVPFMLSEQDKAVYSDLSGVSVFAEVANQRTSFRENILFTHRGLSGPAILQISSYWQQGEVVTIDLLPDIDLISWLEQQPVKQKIKTLLEKLLPKRCVEVFISHELLDKTVADSSRKNCEEIAKRLKSWTIKPIATEGYRTAEVTLGGVNSNELSSKTFEARKVDGLFFVGEVIDVTGWLGGYNFQWAWASGWAAGQVV